MKTVMSNGNRKIDQALKLLGQAANEKKDNLQRSLADQFSNVKEVLEEKGEQIKKAATEVDQRIHNNPWPYIGGVAATAALIGYIFGATRKK